MNDRPTPETDAFAIKFKTTCGKKYWAPVDIARKLERERDELREILQAVIKTGKRLESERDEARQRASDLALGVKVADCMYDFGEYSVALREAKIKARHLQDLTRAAYDEVEKLEDQEGAK